jgi:hypothetical protein
MLAWPVWVGLSRSTEVDGPSQTGGERSIAARIKVTGLRRQRPFIGVDIMDRDRSRAT